MLRRTLQFGEMSGIGDRQSFLDAIFDDRGMFVDEEKEDLEVRNFEEDDHYDSYEGNMQAISDDPFEEEVWK